mgnify:CR=1 FL=1
MSKEKDAAWREMLVERAEESREDTFDSWIVDLKEKEQPETFSIDNEDCEACGS